MASTGLAAIGGIALLLSGYVVVTTPEAQECAGERADLKAQLTGAEVKIELLVESKEACKQLMTSCAAQSASPPPPPPPPPPTPRGP